MSEKVVEPERFNFDRPLDSFVEKLPHSLPPDSPFSPPDDVAYMIWADNHRARVAISDGGNVWLYAENKPQGPDAPLHRWLLDATGGTFVIQNIPQTGVSSSLVDIVNEQRKLVFKN